jgi:DNA repair exonuclease SbcCD ATPase subunit
LDTAQEEQDRLAQDRDHLQKQRAEREAKLQAEKARQTHVQQDLAKAQLALSPTWRADAERAGLAEQHRWRSELKALDERGTETRARDLQQARADLRPLEQAKADLEAEQEKHPAEARRDPAEVQTLLKAAQRHYANCDDEYQKARQEKVLLEKQHQDREQLSQQVLQVDGEFNLYKRLADLLGRDRLQLHLVRRAERQIVDQANTVLDRLSGGQLFLRLVGSNDGDAGSDQALELEAYNKDAGEAPINVAFLSGSQRFRVAVSLALGIGQYASRQHRPIESVIIDEGFGCLDRQGRQVMIQEMQALRDQLRCILLVSHQEEFADAFADGYHFELQEGSTRVRRFQR